ncbi:hypothetical protein C8R46DRAFT_1313902 [Mycena filopes]|nr:hypothetical protein C8R46DRAFT_1313902 [Mycena filopes]
MLALVYASVLSLVVHASIIAVLLLVFLVVARRLAGNSSHIYSSSFTPLSPEFWTWIDHLAHHPSSGCPRSGWQRFSRRSSCSNPSCFIAVWFVALLLLLCIGVGSCVVAAAVSASKISMSAGGSPWILRMMRNFSGKVPRTGRTF